MLGVAWEKGLVSGAGTRRVQGLALLQPGPSLTGSAQNVISRTDCTVIATRTAWQPLPRGRSCHAVRVATLPEGVAAQRSKRCVGIHSVLNP